MSTSWDRYFWVILVSPLVLLHRDWSHSGPSKPPSSRRRLHRSATHAPSDLQSLFWIMVKNGKLFQRGTNFTISVCVWSPCSEAKILLLYVTFILCGTLLWTTIRLYSTSTVTFFPCLLTSVSWKYPALVPSLQMPPEKEMKGAKERNNFGWSLDEAL